MTALDFQNKNWQESFTEEKEVQAIKEIERRLQEKEMQQQESLVLEGTTMETNFSSDITIWEAITKNAAIEACLVTEGAALESCLVNEGKTINDITGVTKSSEKVSKNSSSETLVSSLEDENKSFDKESSSSLGNQANADIVPSYDSDTVTEVPHDMFENVFAHEIKNHEQLKSSPDTYETSKSGTETDYKNSSNVASKRWQSGEIKILFGNRNETSSFETKIKELKMTLAQQTKDFEDVKLDFSKKTNNFETYFEKLEKKRLVLERQSNLSENNTTLLRVKFDVLNRDKGKSPILNALAPMVNVSKKIYMGESSKSAQKKVSQFTTYSLQKDRKFSKKPQVIETSTP
ncbi:hypothetical protein Tco_0998158 [Tanacetum coccineum]